MEFFRWIFRLFSKAEQPKRRRAEKMPAISAAIIPRKEHGISRKAISPYAIKVLYRLNQQGYQAYLVGGGVRDLLLGGKPKDFDVATNASPEEVRKLFRNCRLIGRRFRLAHVYFGAHIVEVATFRRSTSAAEIAQTVDVLHSEDGMILRDNVYGTIEEDAWRRDFSVNALYYNIANFSVVDYVGGLADLKTRTLRILGDPETRYREDPVRMLRAIRFAAKLDFTVHPKTATPIHSLAPLLQSIPSARLFEEILKLFFTGHAFAAYSLLRDFGLFPLLFAQTATAAEKYGNVWPWVEQVLQNTDERTREDKPSHPAFLYAAFLWHPFLQKRKALINEGERHRDADDKAMIAVCEESNDLVTPPKRLLHPIYEIWRLQGRFLQSQPRRVKRLFQHPRFRAAYDFLLLRAAVNEPKTAELAAWWQDYVAQHSVTRDATAAVDASGDLGALEDRGDNDHG